MIMSISTPFDPYNYLARRKFPQAYQPHVAVNGDFTRTRQREIYVSQAEAYIEELRAKPAEELRELLSEEKKKEADESVERLRKEEASRFFNRPEVKADFAHWSKAAYWTLEEAIALSFGKDPRLVNWKTIEAHANVSPFVAEYRNLRDLASRAKHMGQLYDPVVPGIYLAWVSRIGTKIDPRLVDSVVTNGGIVADWKTMFDAEKDAHQATKALLSQQREELLSWAKDEHAKALEIGKSAVAERDTRIRELEEEIARLTRPPEQKLPARERSSLLTLVIGMAVQGYSYDPAALKNSAVPEIASDLSRLGLNLSEDTIRKYLNESKELLPGDEPE